ncbi:MAG: DNA-directed RNA polymerase subunit beta' [Lachnospiraceae bacterium]|nr:DNA-directed RNA polymerase subunit beta' [Ruminococcus sp.]MCM1274316.1 DNA-directed RNA polymerase subunit beta' [Lachnospiraceae bacterium]
MSFSVFESMKIGLASPDQIRAWSHGEVQRAETINYRSQKPEKLGLFCEKIFGPQKDWECNCGKYKRVRYKGRICDKCGVEVTRSKVRRERMGHIELAAPVSHIWYYKGTPSRIGQVLDLTPKKLEEVLYFTKYIVIDPGDKTGLAKKQLLTEEEYSQYVSKYSGIDTFRAGMGAEAIKELLAEIDLDALEQELKAELETTSAGQKQVKLLRRLDVIEAFKNSGNRPEWMILDVIPVIPPDIRPMVQLDGGRYATSDLNELYRKVVMRNNRLKDLLSKKAPDLIVRNEKRMLQEAVDALIDNGRHGRAYTGSNNRPLKSLSDMLKGKQGRFRQNLLGKRVDYSGRSVIVVGPELKMDQCGLPKEMALELFKPFVLDNLVKNGVSPNIKQAKKLVERADDKVWDSLETVIKDHPVLLNRAPTLHRLGIQAFSPILVEGRAIKLHPLCCTAFNADFDGDQMAVHLPLSVEAQEEARTLMLAAKNLLKPSDGKPVTVPTQDMVLGSYYLTIDKAGEKGEGKVFRDANEAIMAYQDGIITIHAAIKVRITKDLGDTVITRIVPTTAGRIIFNEHIPQDLGYVDRTDPDHQLDYEIGFKVRKKELGQIIDRCLKIHGTATTAQVLDNIKAMGYKYSTRSGITVAVCDAEIPPQKAEFIKEADEAIAVINKKFARGFISDNERKESFKAVWELATKKVSAALTANLDHYNNIYMMADSGARGSDAQIRQLAGMRGLIANTSGATIEMPIKANYREGLNVLEYFISSRGARKGLADTALRTADSGYLTRRLVDVSQEVIIRDDDCGTENGIEVYEIREGDELVEKLAERLVGRFLAEDFTAPDGSFTISKDKLLTDSDVAKIVKTGAERVKVRSVLTCELRNGVCARCYGASLANGQLITKGEAVGVIAAQSIGEPGTQLTMRNFHTGGVVGAEDITQGLPRVEELFESRHPKNAAIITRIAGTVRFEEIKKMRHAVITADDGTEEAYAVPFGYRLKVQDGDRVEKGDPLTEGSINPPDVLEVKGEKAVQDYLISEVQKPYRQQGVDINDKHIEVIVRQMMRKIKVVDPGSSSLLAGAVIGKNEFVEICDGLKAREALGESVVMPTSEPVLLGITKASLATDSFMSAASFQETTRVLTEAAIRGKTDPLTGLKENIIIGKLIPAGTGLRAQEEAAAEAEFKTEQESSEGAAGVEPEAVPSAETSGNAGEANA